MAYPFTNPQYAQNGYDQQMTYNQQPTRFGTSSAYYDDGRGYRSGRNDEYTSSYESDQGMRFRSHDSDIQNMSQLHDPSAPTPPEKDISKFHNEGNSPYGAAPAGRSLEQVYTGDSIWTRNHKGAMAARSTPAKIFRTLFCLIINVLIVIVSIICLVVIFARPFNVGLGNVSEPSASSVGVSGTALTFNGSVDFIVSNPNSISTELSLNAKVYDAVDTGQDIGRGSISGAKINARDNTTITFPYQIRYDYTQDKSKKILKDLAQKCGVTGGSSQNLDLTLDISASLKILSVPVPVSFSHDISTACPISSDVLKNIGGGDLLQIVGTLGRRAFDWGALAEL